MENVLSTVFSSPENIRGVLCKILTKNDDSGRHGVLIPVEAYRMFPAIEGFVPHIAVNYTEDIQTEWIDTGSPEVKASKYKHYHRYPERRITRLKSSVNGVPAGTLIIVGRRTDANRLYEIHVIQPDYALYSEVLNEVGITSDSGSFFLDLEWTPETVIEQSEAVPVLLKAFDQVKDQGYIRTLRAGSTGVGYTFETLLGIEENNDSGPDFMGIELKCFRMKDSQTDEKKNLFLKEPQWTDGSQNMNERLRRYGYFDEEKQRQALFSTATYTQNSHGLKLSVDEEGEWVYLDYNGEHIARYDFTTIKDRLDEKLTEAAFIGAKRRGRGVAEEFHYQTLTYYTTPSVREFIALIKSGHVKLEIRMRERKNYGTCFRVMESKLTDLYARAERLREKD